MSGRTDRTMKALVLLLVIGVWGLLLRPVVAPTPAQAQGSRKTQYLFYTCQNTVGEDFSIKEDRFQAVARITGEKVKSGWQLKEVVPDSQTASLLLILEK